MATLPGVDQLETTPDALRALLDGVTEKQTQWKPAPDRWSIAEVLEHLSHVEGHGFRSRVERMVTEDNPHLESYDQLTYAAAGQYSGREAEESFAHFEEQREDNIIYLNGLPLSVVHRTGLHEKLGPITIGQLLNEWAFHDLGHIRQIAELVRVIRYWPNMGKFQSIYRVHP
ncbi:MAG: hypothetical protein JWO80_4684 [Bryobacterales bacterium]|nr:hypothetical protein [Bryobacterales bacterium]